MSVYQLIMKNLLQKSILKFKKANNLFFRRVKICAKVIAVGRVPTNQFA
jgi:hypothetical protein